MTLEPSFLCLTKHFAAFVRVFFIPSKFQYNGRHFSSNLNPISIFTVVRFFLWRFFERKWKELRTIAISIRREFHKSPMIAVKKLKAAFPANSREYLIFCWAFIHDSRRNYLTTDIYTYILVIKWIFCNCTYIFLRVFLSPSLYSLSICVI